MSRTLAALLVCSSGLAAVAGRQSAGRLRFERNGFSIQALEGQPGDAPYTALMMFLPPSKGFAPNVNVVIQPYAGTIDEYAALSKKQFVAGKFKLIREAKVGKVGVLFEYSGRLQGRQLRWYARAILRGDKVYLVTATATKDQWAGVSGKLKACVDSFEIGKGEAPAAPASK
ncbi:MAG: hypothetical protein ISS78_08705 [Phycisphaerae bacterium]|nr:hypothetical protein [Phycisphaerae bacterium]